MIMIHHIVFSILIKETLSKLRRSSAGTALQMIYFCQYSSEKWIFCLWDAQQGLHQGRVPVKSDGKWKHKDTELHVKDSRKKTIDYKIMSWISVIFSIAISFEVQPSKLRSEQNKNPSINVSKASFKTSFKRESWKSNFFLEKKMCIYSRPGAIYIN